jgi:hypothetical protein
VKRRKKHECFAVACFAPVGAGLYAGPAVFFYFFPGFRYLRMIKFSAIITWQGNKKHFSTGGAHAHIERFHLFQEMARKKSKSSDSCRARDGGSFTALGGNGKIFKLKKNSCLRR